MTHTRIGLSALVALLAAGAFWLILAAPREDAPEPSSPSALRASMLERIRSDGGQAAYAAFKEEYTGALFDTAHNAAHLFGESLYEEEGVQGVAACDADFNFGCYHGFFTASVGGEGLDVVAKLDAACATLPVGASACQHGIGHGILEYLGHDRLVEALAACDRTDQPDPLAGCTGGVFMEYNVPFMRNADGSLTVAARPFDEAAGPYVPCGDIPERFRASCVQELPQWWHQIIDRDFKKMGQWCADAPSGLSVGVCISGIAKIIPSSADYSVEGAEALCALMPHGWYDTCITQASWSFESNTPTHEKALALCAHASDAAQKDCPH